MRPVLPCENRGAAKTSENIAAAKQCTLLSFVNSIHLTLWHEKISHATRRSNGTRLGYLGQVLYLLSHLYLLANLLARDCMRATSLAHIEVAFERILPPLRYSELRAANSCRRWLRLNPASRKRERPRSRLLTEALRSTIPAGSLRDR